MNKKNNNNNEKSMFGKYILSTMEKDFCIENESDVEKKKEKSDEIFEVIDDYIEKA